MHTFFVALGWVGNAAYFSRFLIQWIASERAKRTVTPRVFWWLSLFGAVLLAAYSVHQGEHIMLAGYSITAAIYLRNLWIGRPGVKPSRMGALPAALIGLAAAVLLAWVETAFLPPSTSVSRAWNLFGALGMAIWTSRFLLQWLYAERHGDASLPVAFWWLSLVGNLMLLAYALKLADPVFVWSLLPGPLVQARNLMIARRAGDVRGGSVQP